MIRRFLRSPAAVASLTGVLIAVLVAVLAPVFLSSAAGALDPVNALQPPSAHHWLGTDDLGRDLLSRLLVATRLSLVLAIAATAISAVLGIPLGLLALVAGRRSRPLLLRSIDAMQAFPALIVALYVGAALGPGALGPVVGVGIAGCFNYARLASSLALAVGGREFVLAARVTGVRGWALISRHVLPNVAEPLIVATTVNISASIVAISGLSFLGVGVQPPQYDWGRLLTAGVNRIYQTPMGALGPTVAIALVSITFGFLGEGVARVMNPLLATDGGRRAQRRSGNRLSSPALPEERPATPEDVTGDTDGAAVAVRNMSVVFPGPDGPLELVRGVSFTVRRGERVGIVGESGSGKTMTAMAIAHLIPHPGRVTGSVVVGGRDVSTMTRRQANEHLKRELAVVFQDPMSSLNPALTIGRQLEEAVDRPRREASELATQRLGEVGMSVPQAQLRRRPHELSGGMRQRSMIAMGLMNEPALIIADEPTTALDVTIQAQIMDLLESVNRTRQAAVILITHNLALVRQNCDRVLVMYGGRIVEDLPADQLADAAHPYTQALVAAVPDMSRSRTAPLADIPGSSPDPRSRPSGCSYHPRCPLQEGICADEDPALVRRLDGRRVACWVANGVHR